MRQETINIYKASELNDDAKKKAHDAYLYRGDTWYWGSEAVNSLKKFCDFFNVKLKDYSLSSDNCDVTISLDHWDDVKREIKGARLMAYLNNNYYTNLFRRKKISAYRNIVDGKKHPKRASKCQWEEIDGALTGYYEDETLLQPIIKFMTGKYTDSPLKTDFEMLINECIADYCNSVKSDIEDSESLEYFIDHADANEYEYLEDGTEL